MAADKIKVFRGKTKGRRVIFIHCPRCRGFDYERRTKRAAVDFARDHANAHEGIEIEVTA